MSESSDPSDVHTIAVTLSDIVAAAELNRTSDDTAVLRLTPPFSGRMRARLHVERSSTYTIDPAPVHIDPQTLLGPDAPTYPRPADTEDELRADSDVTYTVERHHERHEAAVETWRTDLGEAIRERAEIETPAGPTDVRVTVLGDTERQHENAE